MDGDDVTKLLLAALALATAGIPLARGRGSRRNVIKQDLEILNSLPPDSDARSVMMTHIEGSIVRLLYDENLRRRDPTTIWVGAVMMAISVIVAAIAVSSGGWWWLLLVPSGVALLFGAVGLGEGIALKERDEKGRAIPQSASVDEDGEPA